MKTQVVRIVLMAFSVLLICFFFALPASAGMINDADLINSVLTWENTTGYHNLCLLWVHDALVATGAYDGEYSVTHWSAQVYWNNLVGVNRAHPSAGNPVDIPLGADVFFSSPPGYGNVGHVGIYIGDGKFISAINLVEIHSFWDDPQNHNYWANSYYGWAWHDGITVTPDIPINESRFPDPRFRENLSGFIDTDQNGFLSEAEIEATKFIECASFSVKTLTGIEYFTNLEWLICCDNELKLLDLSKNNALIYVDCAGNGLESINLGKKDALRTLVCYDNRLYKLNLGGCRNLEYLICEKNQISSLVVSDCRKLSELVKRGPRGSDDYCDYFGRAGNEDYAYSLFRISCDPSVVIFAGPVKSEHVYTDDGNDRSGGGGGW